VLALAAHRGADIVGIKPSLAAGYVGPEVAATATAAPLTASGWSWVREAAGSRFDQLELQMLSFAVQVVPNGRELLESMAPAFGLSTEDILDVPIRAGRHRGRDLRDARAPAGEGVRPSATGWSTTATSMPFAPVVARLAGT